MYDQSKSSQLPDKQKFASTFRLLSRISYWIHLILGTISGVALLLVIFSRDANNNSSGAGIGIFIAVFSLIALVFRVYWAWRYSQLAKTLQNKIQPGLQPSRAEIIRVLRIGLLVSLAGLFLAFIASEISLVSLVVGAISRPQGIAVYEREQVVKIADLLLILAQLNILGAHFFGSVNSIGLLNWLSKEEV
jgi:membrane protein YdbS with pleckstrin-like domain